MKKLILLAIAVLSMSASALAQYSVTATITDTPDGQAWIGGTYNVTFDPTTAIPSVPPGTVTVFNGVLDGTGSFAVTLPSITSTGAPWKFTLCPQASPAPNASTSCVVIKNIQVSASGSLSATLSAYAKSPRFAASLSAYGYRDSEVNQPSAPGGPGYFNVISQLTRQWNGAAWQNWGGSGGGGATFTPSGLQFATSTTAATVATSAQIVAAANVTPTTQFVYSLIPIGVSLASYDTTNLPVTYGNITSGSNIVSVNDGSSWVNGEGIFIPGTPTTATYPAAGIICDNVTVSGNTITMFNVGGSACNATWTAVSHGVIVLHFNSTHGAITSGSNSLALGSAVTFATGQGIRVAGAGAAGADLICPVISLSGTTATLFQANGSTACNAGTTVAVAKVFHDDTLNLQNALAAGNFLKIPKGTYYLSSETDIGTAATIYGEGQHQSIFVSAENGITTIDAKSSGITVKDLAIIASQEYTPTSGVLLSDCDPGGLDLCFHNTFSGLLLNGGWNSFAAFNKTIEGWFKDSAIHAPVNAAIYINNPPGYGDLNFTDLQITNCNSGCTTGTYGILVDAADTNIFSGVKLNSFIHNIWITAQTGNVDHLRFNNVSFEDYTTSLGSAIQNLSTFQVFGNQFNGGETEDKLTIGNGVTGTQINGLRSYGGAPSATSVLDIAGQNTTVTGGSMQLCTGDCIRIETTATNTTLTGNTIQGATGYGINNLGTLTTTTNTYIGNQITGATSGSYEANDSPGVAWAPITGQPVFHWTNTGVTPGGLFATMLSPNITAGGYAQYVLGRDLTTAGNASSMGFWYVGSANACNSMFFGINNVANEMQMTATGLGVGVAIGTCPSNTIQAVGDIGAQSFKSNGTTFTASGCTNSTLVGGATAGSYHSGTTGTCTVTVTMGNTQTATHGWACHANDLTTPADTQPQTATTTTTATFSGTTVTGDVVNFGCVGY